MILSRVTSLADLVFKAKTNKYYKILAIITAEYLEGSLKQKTYENAMNTLYRVARTHNPDTCFDIVETINSFRDKVEKDPEFIAEQMKNAKPENISNAWGTTWLESYDVYNQMRQREQLEREFEEQERRWQRLSQQWNTYMGDSAVNSNNV